MKLSQSLSSRLTELFINGHWITNTNYKELLLSTDIATAVQKLHNLNSIAELTYHINYYLAGLNNVFSGGDLEISDKYSFDMKPIASEEAWQMMVSNLVANAEIFIKHVAAMSEEQLHGPFIVDKYGTYLRNIEGVIEHAYYHLGQMVLIKKMIKD
jgi:hypothetical protein